MEQFSEAGAVVEREELMVSPAGDSQPTMRLAHFLQPSVTSIDGEVFDLPTHCFSSKPPTFQPKKWPSKVNFNGWRMPQKDWREWVVKMAALNEPTWRKAGIYEAVLNSTYRVRKNSDLVLGLAEKWCPETKSFVFCWGEATITLEDMMVCGYSVMGSPIFIASVTEDLKEREERLNQARLELNRMSRRNAEHCLWLKKFMNSGSDIEHEAFLALWLSRFVFPITTSLIARCVFPIVVQLAKGTKIALAPAVLASIYRDLSLLKEKIVAFSEFGKSKVVGSRVAAVTVMSPFQLVQIWAWERFIELRPKPNLIKIGEPRFARWDKMNMSVENVRWVLDSARDSFDWRPYAKALRSWNLNEFYGEKGMWVAVDSDLSEELEAFARCLRISMLVGLECVEHYLPHRVAMQFGIDQDLPGCAAQAKDSIPVAWSKYSKSIGYANLYIPSRFYEADVTTRYLEWWKQSWLSLQGGSKDVLRRKKTFRMFKISRKLSKRAMGFHFTSFKMQVPQRLKRTRSNFTKFGTTSKKLDEIKIGGGASSHPSFGLKISKKPLDGSSEWRKKDSDPPVRPDIPSNSNLEQAEETTEEDDMAMAELLRYGKRHDATGSGQLYDGKCLGNKEVTRTIDPLTALIKKTPTDATVKSGLETAKEDASATEIGTPRDDMERCQGCERDINQYAADIEYLQLEERISKLEKFFAEIR